MQKSNSMYFNRIYHSNADGSESLTNDGAGPGGVRVNSLLLGVTRHITEHFLFTNILYSS